MADEEDKQTGTPDNVRRKATGPRTEHGKAISRRNSLKFGFFSKEIVIDSLGSRRDFLRLCRGLAGCWKPVGTAEILQVELAAVQLFQLRRFLRVQRLFTLDSNASETLKSDWPQDSTFRGVVEQADQDKRDTVAEVGLISPDLSRIERSSKVLPSPIHLEWLNKTEAHILRMYYRAVAELERMQQIRLGKGVPTHPVNKVKKR